MGAVVVEFVL